MIGGRTCVLCIARGLELGPLTAIKASLSSLVSTHAFVQSMLSITVLLSDDSSSLVPSMYIVLL